jgi:hypothetical protein
MKDKLILNDIEIKPEWNNTEDIVEIQDSVEIPNPYKELFNKLNFKTFQKRRLEWYLKEIRKEELKAAKVSNEDYKTTGYNSNIIRLIEEALLEIPMEDCRYQIFVNGELKEEK